MLFNTTGSEDGSGSNKYASSKEYDDFGTVVHLPHCLPHCLAHCLLAGDNDEESNNDLFEDDARLLDDPPGAGGSAPTGTGEEGGVAARQPS